MPPVTVRGLGVERKGDRLLAVFTLSEAPGRRGSGSSASAPASALSAATFRRNRLHIDLAEESDLAILIRSVEAIIETSNFDVEFRAAERQ